MLKIEMKKVRTMLIVMTIISCIATYLCYSKGGLIDGLRHDYFPVLVPLACTISILILVGQFLLKKNVWRMYILAIGLVQLLILWASFFMILNAIGGHASLYETAMRNVLGIWTLLDTGCYVWCCYTLKDIDVFFKEQNE